MELNDWGKLRQFEKSSTGQKVHRMITRGGRLAYSNGRLSNLQRKPYQVNCNDRFFRIPSGMLQNQEKNIH